MSIIDFATGYDGTDLRICNNIFIGITIFPKKATVANNIVWSASNSEGWISDSLHRNSKIVSSTNEVTNFEGTGFMAPLYDFLAV